LFFFDEARRIAANIAGLPRANSPFSAQLELIAFRYDCPKVREQKHHDRNDQENDHAEQHVRIIDRFSKAVR
jgi:hypothetical protein